MGGKFKRYLRKLGKITRAVKTWQLILILILGLFLTATMLRFDHLKMVALKNQVLEADKEGDDQKISESLKELKKFTLSHTVINILEKNGKSEILLGTGPFYLEKQYQRKASEEIQKLEKKLEGMSENPNGNVFAKAMAVCKPQAIRLGWAWNSPEYLNCMTGEIGKYPTQNKLENQFTAQIPPASLYRHNYASPFWTPAPAGILMAICLIILIIIMIRGIVWLVLALALMFIKD